MLDPDEMRWLLRTVAGLVVFAALVLAGMVLGAAVTFGLL